MLHIIGLILKIIGIMIAAILGILVLLVCITLFEPVRYEIAAEFPGSLDEIKVQAKVSWLFHLISGRAEYKDGGMTWRFRLVWKKFGEGVNSESRESAEKENSESQKAARGEKSESQEAAKKENSESQKAAGEENSGSQGTAGEEKFKNKEWTEEEKAFERQTAIEGKADLRAKKDSGEQSALSEKADSKRKTGKRRKYSFWQKVSRKIKAIFQKIKYTFRQICDKIKMIIAKKEKVMRFLEDEVHRSAFARFMKETVWLRRFLKPKRLNLKLHFGFEEPHHTGQALAGFSMIYPFVGEYMDIIPDFEKRVLEGDFYIKGKLRMIHLVIMAWKLFWDKNVRSTFQEVRKLIKSI